MRKNNKKSLSFNPTTIRSLSEAAVANAHGAAFNESAVCQSVHCKPGTLSIGCATV